MKKKYLVDSENVGDVWVPLLVFSQPEDEVFVFYTQKSPHMNYENVRLLKETEKEAEFIKCFEGSNALDFQLVTQLGYLLCEDTDCEYVIVSNDTGFDAAVRYWTARNRSVRRLTGKECSKQTAKFALKTEDAPENTQAATAVSDTQDSDMQKSNLEKMDTEKADLTPEVPKEKSTATEEKKPASEKKKPVSEKKLVPKKKPVSEKKSVPEKKPVSEKKSATEKQSVSEKKQVPEKNELQNRISVTNEAAVPDTKPEQTIEKSSVSGQTVETENVPEMLLTDIVKKKSDQERIVKTLFSCISKDHLADFHNALVMFFGEAAGKELYQQIKGDPEYTAYWAKLPENSQEEKFDVYCRIVFEHSELADSYPEDFSEFLFKSNGKRNNLNSLRAALQGQYGKDKGMKYYSLFKTHIKIMNRM